MSETDSEYVDETIGNDSLEMLIADGPHNEISETELNLLAHLINHPELLQGSSSLFQGYVYDGYSEGPTLLLWRIMCQLQTRREEISEQLLHYEIDQAGFSEAELADAHALTQQLFSEERETSHELGRRLVADYIDVTLIPYRLEEAHGLTVSSPPELEQVLGFDLSENLTQIQNLKSLSRDIRERGRPGTDHARFIGIEELLLRDTQPEWLIEDLLVAGQPCIIGGPKKSMKTSIILDLALSLAVGPIRRSIQPTDEVITDREFRDHMREIGECRLDYSGFLGHYTVSQPRRVGLMSGESGEHVIKETFLRIVRSHRLRRTDYTDNLSVSLGLPNLGQSQGLAKLQQQIRELELEVLIIDPLYLCLLDGNTDVSASNLFEMGPLLRNVAETCLSEGCTPILVHHTKKSAQFDLRTPPDLDDLAFSGISEFARQWILVSRREKLDLDAPDRVHRLWLGYGGSFGHGGLKAVDIREGRLLNNFQGRRWLVRVRTPAEVSEEQREARELGREEGRAAKLDEAETFISEHPEGVSKTTVRTAINVSGHRVTDILEELEQLGRIRIERTTRGNNEMMRCFPILDDRGRTTETEIPT
jgi:hypothetical protein